MNTLPGILIELESADGIALAEVEVARKVRCTAMLVGASDPAWTAGRAVTLAFNEAEVALAKGRTGLISLRNLLPCTVIGIEEGRLLSRVRLECAGYPLSALITTGSVRRLALAPGDTVEALIKANEMALLDGAS
ncbi:TOBE domain-containing protein [Chitiniphilus eburneus]|uniref:Mop domain-containing protein n=1 Tax=Chitiniphilus eburneus TaxID=2571148 RepID=A0A4V5MNP7_9NEIS|nr:TOBE domain-containing protein [Chitiniphilus eburneus]TJZ65638.1 hypothetical protein FAZ21_18060 [Chitiniphilus eburneus]